MLDGDYHYNSDDYDDDLLLNEDLGEPDDVAIEDFVLGITHYQTPKRPSSFVYIMHAPISGLVKIGKSDTPETRRTSIQHTSGLQIELIAVFGCESSSKALTIEKRLHERFAKYRGEYGEWFRPESALRSWLVRTCEYDPRRRDT